jgi:hypothetical protein
MALSKTINQQLDIPSKFKDYRFSGHVADAASPDAGKLIITFSPASPVPPGRESDFIFSGAIEDVPDAVLTQQQRDKVRAHLKKCLAYWQEQAGATGTPDADLDEPAP